MTKVFAAGVPRDSLGRILFNMNDQDYRKSFFPEEVMSHPAKANLYMLEAIIDYISEPG